MKVEILIPDSVSNVLTDWQNIGYPDQSEAIRFILFNRLWFDRLEALKIPAKPYDIKQVEDWRNDTVKSIRNANISEIGKTLLDLFTLK